MLPETIYYNLWGRKEFYDMVDQWVRVPSSFNHYINAISIEANNRAFLEEYKKRIIKGYNACDFWLSGLLSDYVKRRRYKCECSGIEYDDSEFRTDWLMNTKFIAKDHEELQDWVKQYHRAFNQPETVGMGDSINGELMDTVTRNAIIENEKRTAQMKQTIFDYIVYGDNQEQKQEFLDVLHTLIDGKKGKHVALVVGVCVNSGLLTKPPYSILTSTFGNIGAKSGYNKLYSNGLKHYTQEEINGIETHLKPFIDGL